MIKITFRVFLALLSGLAFLPSYGQEFLKTRVDQFNRFQDSIPAQKLFVTLDKPSYVAGETIWFSTFLVDASFHQLSALTNTVYIDLISPDNKVVARRMLHSPLGISWGQLSLPDSLRAGTYTLHGYTNYMRNSGANFFFRKSIPVYNQQNLPVAPANTGKIDLQFFAEGGNFLIGVENKVAFKAIGSDGLPVEVSGEIVDKSGTVVTNFRSEHDGMGAVLLLPAPGNNYTAILENGSEYQLPDVEFSGYILRIKRKSDHIECFIYRNVTDGNGEIGLIAQSRGIVRFAAGGKIGNSSIIRIPYSDLPTGISQLTLFNGEGLPVCERLVFVNHKNSLDITVKTSQSSYGPREKVDVTAQVTDPVNPEKDTTEVFFTATVFDKKAYPDRSASMDDIVSYLYLSSDLTGYIHQPAYYFRDTTATTQSHADLLMITQGWRRFTWKDLANPPTSEFRHEKGIPIRGKITRAISQKPYPNGNIEILNLRGGTGTSVSDELGNFYNDELVFFDSTELVIETSSKKGNQSEYDLHVKPPFQPEFLSAPSMPDLYGPAEDYIRLAGRQVEIDDGYKATTDVMMLEEVTIKEEEIKDEINKYYGMPDRSLSTENLPKSSPNIIESIRGRFAGVLISGSPLQPTISIRGGGTPLFLLDGIVVNQYTILNIPPDQIESVDLIKGNNGAIFGADGANGVLAFYTKRGYQDYSVRSLGMNTIKYAGYSAVREFYHPRYDVESDRNDLPDMRTTLFWQPLMKCNPDGKLDFSFYTSDSGGSFEIILQGITLEGNPGTSSHEFQMSN